MTPFNRKVKFLTLNDHNYIQLEYSVQGFWGENTISAELDFFMANCIYNHTVASCGPRQLGMQFSHPSGGRDQSNLDDLTRAENFSAAYADIVKICKIIKALFLDGKNEQEILNVLSEEIEYIPH